MAKQDITSSPLTLVSLTIGFALSVILTIIAYGTVVLKWITGDTAIYIVIGLAVVQVIVQLVFFLHFGRESKPRWNMQMFYFMLVFLGIMVAGSLWIMYNLNYNMMDMSPQEMDIYMIEQSDKGF